MANKKETKPKRTLGGTISKVLIAAAILSTMVLTVSAAELGWFQRYFEKQSDQPLTAEQVEYIQQNEQTIGAAQTQEGYTLRLKSVITDGRMAYITLSVVGPEDAVLSKTVKEGFDPAAPSLCVGNWAREGMLTTGEGRDFFGSSSIGSMEDYDGLDNTQDLLITLNPDAAPGEVPFGPGQVWKLHLEELTAQYQNLAYLNELMDGKYKGQENFFFADEESKILNPVETLAKGPWDFEIDFSDCNVRNIELIKEPVKSRACIGWKDGQDIFGDVTIKSFVLSSLSATITIEETICPDFNDYANNKEVQAVMKDGSRMTLDCSSASSGETGGKQEFEARQPILLDNVDYIQMPDGVKIPMP